MYKEFTRFGPAHKIRTISADTNVISDMVPYMEFIKRRKPPTTEDWKEYFERCKQSAHSLSVSLSFKVKLCGTPIVRKEMRRKPNMLKLYDNFFYDGTLEMKKEIRALANCYVDTINIDNADALIVATLSIHRIDLFLTWNRDDILNANNIRQIRSINKRRRHPLPTFCTPKEFLERVFTTNALTMGISEQPIPPKLRPLIFGSK